MSHAPLNEFINQVITRIGFTDAVVRIDTEAKKGAITINDFEGDTKQLQEFIEALNHIVGRYGEKKEIEHIFFDINNYRQTREILIQKITHAAAEKVRVNEIVLELPSMNSYERRLVHSLIAEIPDVISESTGEGRERRVTIKKVKND